MLPPAIKLQDISKKFMIHKGPQASYGLLRDQITNAFIYPARLAKRILQKNNGHNRQDKKEELWALKDINLEIQQGEVVGLIGPNGAGKSTLLKILTRITEPSGGMIDLYGRVGSLLEVGTGFHKELTGRENIYLNGAILGMKRHEINQKFDEIVEFAEVGKFINTPVKFYSSGMAVRLAFAVAAHLEPEILLVDEVLAVGDAAFQKKCLNKMEDVGKHGRTVIFVSHHMPSITRLCERAILLNGGQVVADGQAHQIVGDYLSDQVGAAAQRDWPNPHAAPGSDFARIRQARIINKNGETAYTHDIRNEIGVEMTFEILKEDNASYPLIYLHNEEGIWLFTSIDQDPNWIGKTRPPGIYKSIAWIPGNYLSEGTMTVDVSCRTEVPGQIHYYEKDVIAFQVIEGPVGFSARRDYPGLFPGVVRPILKWETHYESNK